MPGRARILIGLLAIAGCFTPTFPSRPCGPDGECPDGQACDIVQELCLPEADACTARPCQETVLDVPATINRDLDLLFVVDDSGGMIEHQMSMAVNFPRFIDVLETLPGGMPSVNIGVVSTDLGAGGFEVTGCEGNGDGGMLLSTRGEGAPVGCTGPDGAFIQDWDDGFGGRTRNYDVNQGLGGTFACIAERGNSGCGFEQPLESMRRALNGSVAANAEFLRGPAALAVIVLADEDDCSARDPAMFDTASTTVDDPFGPLSSYRCFEYGVDCETGNEDRRAPGPRMNCSARVDSPYMDHTDVYVDFVRGLKEDPAQIAVTAIIGDPTPVSVNSDSETGNPELGPSCSSPQGEASPGVRLGRFADAFAPARTVDTICNEDLSDAMILSAAAILPVLGHPCIERDIDLDLDTPGLQYQCEAADIRFAGTPGEEVTPLAECNPERSNIPCWYLWSDPVMCAGMLLAVDRGGATPPTFTRVRLRCLVQ